MNLPRAVAVDMDGTFLRPDMDYDRERFALLRQVLTEAGCRFVVASGNQYAQLASFFDAPERLSFVAENGGLVVDAGTLVHVTVLDAEAISAALDAFDALPDADVALCGVRSAYLRFPDARSRPQLSPYYHRLTSGRWTTAS